MSATSFQAWFSKEGDLLVNNGPVIQPSSGVVLATTAGAVLLTVLPPRDGAPLTMVGPVAGTAFLGGSGRNLWVSGLADLEGYWQPTRPGTFIFGIFTITVTGPDDAEVSDGSDVVAILTTGGAAPVGAFDSTSYGETTYNGGSPFTLTGAAEIVGGGAVPDLVVYISNGTAQGGVYTAVDAVNFVSADDSDWTIEVMADGTAELRHLGVTVAVRPEASAHNAGGVYEALRPAWSYNVVSLGSFDGFLGELPGVNPFGVLTIVYEWQDQPDLDTTTGFDGATVGFPGPYTTSYMTHQGDTTTAGGTETVTVDLFQAFVDSVITSTANLTCAADWFPGATPSQGSGPAMIHVRYSLAPDIQIDATIVPGLAGPASTPVVDLTVDDTGAVTATAQAAWRAAAQVVGRLPREGYVYVQVDKVAGVLDSVAGPFFATALPASTTDTLYYPLAWCSGTEIVQYHTGPLVLW